MDAERDRLALLVTEACHLRWYAGVIVDSHLASMYRRDKARESLPAIESRMHRRQAQLRNLDALILCHALDPSELQELAERC